MYKFQAPKNEKALYRVGQLVTVDYHPGKVFKVCRKDFELNGAVLYTVINPYATANADFYIGGLRQKYLNKAGK